MSQRREKNVQKREAKMSATVRARMMLIEAAGPREWSDTREAWIARGARFLGISYRRAKKLFYEEPLKLGADEYHEIERNYATATQAVAALSHLARESNVSLGRSAGVAGGGGEGEGRRPDEEARGRPAKEAAGD